jgi:hypothetical protein
MNEQDTMDRSWNFNLNVAGVVAPSGSTNMEVTEGYYKVVVSDCYVNPERNTKRVIFKMTIAEGPFTGVVRTTGMKTPDSAEDNVRYYWRGVLESCGYGATELDTGELSIAPGTFKDRAAHIYFAPKGHNGSQYEEVKFLAPTAWMRKAEAFVAQSAIAPVGATGSVLGSNGAGNAVPGTTSKSDVLAKLGINA